MKHRLALALAAAAALLAAAGPAAAECSAVFKAGAKFHIVEKKVGSSRPLTITVVRDEKGYAKLDVSVDKTKEKFSMPGHVEGDTAMFAGSQRPVVWTCTCDPKGATCHDSGPTSEGTADLRLDVGH
ncbi:MAG TPA: hypothetical protein VMN04_13175 [Thermoanaerobaculia bacterium]|nr:hypothetical protein [Thermoanaerobaculia bacterium]